MAINYNLLTTDKAVLLRVLKNGLDNVQEISSTPSEQDIVLFTGSLIDKSEIYYRRSLGIEGVFFTIVEEDIKEEDIASFWHKNTIVITNSIANKLFNAEKRKALFTIIDTIKSFTLLDAQQYLEKDSIKDYMNFNNIRPINNSDFSNFLGGLASGFRGASTEKNKSVYKLKYTPKDKKGTKAIIVQFSIEDTNKPYRLLSLSNINSEKDLQEFYSMHKIKIEDFLSSSSYEQIINYNDTDVLLTDKTDDIGKETYFILSYEDGKSIALFDDDKLLSVDGISNFFLIKNYTTKNILPKSLDNYKHFVTAIKSFDNTKKFIDSFAKIINKSSNYFLIQQLRKDSGDASYILHLFYSYILSRNKDDIPSNQISAILNVILSTEDINALNEKFIINCYFFIRNTILKNSNHFLSEFDEYKKQDEIDKKILEDIESCIGDIQYEKSNELDNSTRFYNYDYLKHIKNRMLETKCKKDIDDINEILEKLNITITSFEFNSADEDVFSQATIVSEEYLSGEILVVDRSLSKNIAKHLSYIHKLLTMPLANLTKDFEKNLKLSLLLDLVTMWAIEYKCNNEKTLSNAKLFLQLNYLKSSYSKEKKEAWRYIVINQIFKLYKKHIEFDEFSNLIQTLDLETFDFELNDMFNLSGKNKYNNLITQQHHKLEDFIGLKAASNKFNEYFKRETEDKHYYYIKLFRELFGENGVLYSLLENDNKDSEIIESEEFKRIKEVFCKKSVIKKDISTGMCLDFLRALSF